MYNINKIKYIFKKIIIHTYVILYKSKININYKKEYVAESIQKNITSNN